MHDLTKLAKITLGVNNTTFGGMAPVTDEKENITMNEPDIHKLWVSHLKEIFDAVLIEPKCIKKEPSPSIQIVFLLLDNE